jgi:glycosyltransferase involved in cell wall biosynthesis
VVKRGLVSAVVICRSEDPDIEECIRALRNFEETIVVFDGKGVSSGKARRLGARVFIKKWRGFAAQKNFALSKARCEWVISVDSDEFVTPELAEEIMTAAESGGDALYYVPIKNYFYGRWLKYSGLYPDYHMRFFRRKGAFFTGAMIHESVSAKGAVKKYLKGALVHSSKKSISEHITAVNLYTGLEAAEAVKAGRKPTGYSVFIKPFYSFVKFYIFKLGFLDGFEGLVFNVLKALYMFGTEIKTAELSGLGTAGLLKTLFKRSR